MSSEIRINTKLTCINPKDKSVLTHFICFGTHFYLPKFLVPLSIIT
jgi:hypothetical protein